MNIVAILANGVGNRFDSNIPKQFHKICGKMVIEYVIEAAINSKNADGIIISSDIDRNSAYLSELKERYCVDIINGGETRNKSLGQVIKYISLNYKCSKLIVCDAVRPLITKELICDYFDYLDKYDAVVTAQKITDSLGCYNVSTIDREQYYLMQSPEGFNFELLESSFDSESAITEVTQQFPAGSKIKLNFNFNNNYKLTFPADLKYLEIIIKERSLDVNFYNVLNSVQRLKKYLDREYGNLIDNWINNLQNTLPLLLKKWKIDYLEVLKTSHFGIVLFADSLVYDKCVIKIVPPFIDRYEQEKNCYKDIDSSIMCGLIDYDNNTNTLLLERCNYSEKADFYSGNRSIIELFEKTKKYFCTQNIESRSGEYSGYYNLLLSKMQNNRFEYKTQTIMDYIDKAIKMYNTVFKDDKKGLIHGDMHRHNIVEKNGKLVAIDPIGFIAPFEFELARYICTELTDGDSYSKTRFAEIVDDFSVLAEKEKIVSACYIDMVFRLHNSIFENDNYDLTNKWLSVLETLFED